MDFEEFMRSLTMGLIAVVIIFGLIFLFFTATMSINDARDFPPRDKMPWAYQTEKVNKRLKICFDCHRGNR